ncbi:hypothetical protein NRB20_69900 [Nocardia sp. RB20]|uniref:Uncharacterized protein n=2 Tax=Nocardia macrotermitis TaxID=2585198 RepID=A0A7K0DDS2_9NOCA|nr:hypothetical protein [Nocardia macrotermitis]
MLTEAAKGATVAEHALADTARVATDTMQSVKGAATVANNVQRLFDTMLPKLSWQAVAVILAAMGLGAFLLIRSCSGGLPSMPGTNPVDALPQVVRSAASCPAAGVGNCVITGTDSLLSGGLTGGRDLPLSVQVDSVDQVSDVVRRWHAAGATVLADGAVFVGVGPSNTVWYADTRTGLRIETGTFASRMAAQTFLVRAGLIR